MGDFILEAVGRLKVRYAWDAWYLRGQIR